MVQPIEMRKAAASLNDINYRRVDALYHDLTSAFPHPFDWITLLRKPSVFRRKARVAHQRMHDIFMEHGFVLNEKVASDYYHNVDGHCPFTMDAGGHMTSKLSSALVDQMFRVIREDGTLVFKYPQFKL